MRRLLQESILSQKDDCLTIYVLEAVLIYLDEGIPRQLLALLSQSDRNEGDSVLLFADTLPLSDVEGSEALARRELEAVGWRLHEWCRKVGRTRHLGWASSL